MTTTIEIYSVDEAIIKDKDKETTVNSVSQFLRDIIKGTCSLSLHQVKSIELLSEKLPDSLLILIMELDRLLDNIESVQNSLNKQVKWMTESNFQCSANCKECCASTYYFPSELDDLPEEIIQVLIQDEEGKWNISQKDEDPRCIFFSEDNAYNCSIHQYRPLRCRIYPFFPIIHQDQILIYRESHIRMKNEDKAIKNWDCPGIKGEQLEKDLFENIISDFVKKSLELPLVASVLCVNPKRVLKINS